MRIYLQRREAQTVTRYEIAPQVQKNDISSDVKNTIRSWHSVDGIPKLLAQFETVFWEPDDTNSLRQWLAAEPSVRGASILEIGTGTGLVALHASLLGANRVIATDINPSAVANARYNAMHLGLDSVEFRLVVAPADAGGELAQPGPFTMLRPDERFDFILSNPPWENDVVENVAAYALYDTDFVLLDGLLKQSQDFLKPGGQLLLAYGATQAIKRIQELAPAAGWSVELLDDRELDSLPDVFLPAMLLRLERSQ